MAFRVTNSMMVSNYNRNQNAAQVRMHDFQTQLSTQKKIARLSDDPVNIVKSLNARSRLYDVEQYKKNIDDAKAWLTQTESALFELNELIKRGYELAVHAANDVLTSDDRSAISHEILQLRDQVGTLANSTLGDKFIFGGYNVSSPPFTFNPIDPSFTRYTFDEDRMVQIEDLETVVVYNYDTDDGDWDLDLSHGIDLDDPKLQHIAYSMGIGLEFDVAVSGARFLGHGTRSMITTLETEVLELEVSNNVYITFHKMFSVLNVLSDLNLEEGEGAEILHRNIHPILGQMQYHQSQSLALMAEVGGRLSRLELMSDRYMKDELNYTQMKSDVEDLDLAEAIMWFSMTEAVYRASLGVGGRILPPSLMDFLR
jgi:flagellar hook-associated protein 3 FlgL